MLACICSVVGTGSLFPCSHLGWPLYVDYYCRDHPSLFLKHYDTGAIGSTDSESDMTENEPIYSRSSPPSIFEWLLQLIRGNAVGL